MTKKSRGFSTVPVEDPPFWDVEEPLGVATDGAVGFGGDNQAFSSVWHPFTQHKIFPKAMDIERTQGVYLYPKGRDKPLIDGISSWWINIHGHCHPKIVEAVKEQAGRLDQVIFAGFTHAPAEELAERLVAETGAPLTKVFFSDSGSTAVEVALKMAVGAWHNNGQKRTKIITLEHGYHGDTFGTMAAGARSVYSAAYDPFLFDVVHLPFPEAGQEQASIEAFKAVLDQNGSDIAAFICEPMVLGAGGMLMYSAETLKAYYDLCKKHGIYFIADEVMTGWGRTGPKWAHESAGCVPDILCSSKGLTAGYLPLAVTLCSDEIFNAFYSDDRAKTFFHSSSFTGNPLACAAANASLQIWKDEPVAQRIKDVGEHHQEFALRLHERACQEGDIENIRQAGTILAFDIKTDGGGYLANIGPKLYNYYLDQGVLLRPLGNTVYILPPYVITKSELEQIYDTIIRSLDYIRNDRAQCTA